MENIILVFHILFALAIIGLVLIQHGKGAEVGAAFGSGASNTVFGSQGTGSFLTRLTTALAILFACTSLALSYIPSHRTPKQGLGAALEAIEQSQALQAETPDTGSSGDTSSIDTDLPSIPNE